MSRSDSAAGKTAIIQYSYEGTPISFSNTDGVMINATQMAKPFGKEAKHWLNNQQTKDFLEELTKVRNLTLADLVQVKKGGNNPGTWMHEDVALEFARWLSPKFAIWCNDRIKELLTSGVATVSDDDDIIAQAMNVLQRRLDAKQQQLQLAQSTIETQNHQIQTLTPMADYTREVLQSTSTFTLTEVAKDLGMRSVAQLTSFLHQQHIFYRQSDRWLPTANYSARGFFSTRTAKFFHNDGSIGTSLSTVVTEKGRLFIRKLYQQQKGGAL